ncbi:alpha-amylase family protein [Microbacterium sp. SD291]|uniref:alpha-amylase family protein n=1 Tax=Microbacterium sp. SD291 TaxID=2782007 RepID=UPI001A969DED|nr:alpha-amylase family protein [Microbacterium sp. SD291]MBO0981249.1 alpha-amylase family protein [Microbacterium sp. SD291]
MRPADTSDLWWRTAVIYCLDIETFQDSDGDGVGDLEGLANRIEYLAELGITCLWLMPFQPTRDLDDGYDITDFYGVDPRLGDLGHVVELLRIAHGRGMRVIIDLVVNHTSDRHPWFVAARRSTRSRYRDYYVWRDRPPRGRPKHPVFPGEEQSVWEKDERSGQYYLHSFYRHQPDLNLENPDVRAEIARIVGFWTKLGVDGFRIDAVPFLIQPPGAADETDPHAFLRELRRFAGRRAGHAVLLGEVGLPHRDQLDYFGGSETELDLQFDFVTAQTAFLAFVRGDARPLAKVLRRRPTIDVRQGWATFLRNHDELSLELLEKDERAAVFAALAPDEKQRVYGRGIVRRLAPMLGGDPRRLRLAYSLLFSLPGAPVLFYGEEIGMGEQPELGDRAAVRSPMQWDRGAYGGFSATRPSRSITGIPDSGYGPDHVNVHDQLRDPDSLLSFVQVLISRYRAAPEIAWGEFTVLDAGEHAVLAHRCRADDRAVLFLHNFSDEPRHVELKTADVGGDRLHDLLAGGAEQAEDGRFVFDLAAYAQRWLRITEMERS